MHVVSTKDRVVEAITKSVLEHGRAATVQQGAERAYEALKSAGLLIEEQHDIKTD